MDNSSTPYAPVDLREVDAWLRWIHWIVVVVLTILSLAGNATVLLLVWKYRQLREWHILITLGVVVSDLLQPFMLNFQAIASTAAARWPFGDGVCTFLGYMTSILFYMRLVQTGAIALDRFLDIVYPFFYARWKKRIILPFLVVGWILPLATSLPPAVGLDAIFGAYSFTPTYTVCTITCASLPCVMTSTVIFTGYAIVGAFSPTVIYLFLFCYGRYKLRRAHHQLGTQGNVNHASLQHQQEEQQRSEEELPPSRDCVENGVIARPAEQQPCPAEQPCPTPGDAAPWTSTNDPPVAGEQRTRRNRALVTFVLLFITLTITPIPTYIIGSLRQTQLYPHIPVLVHFIAIDVYMLSPVLDSIVIMRNRDFRHTFSRLCGRTSHSSVIDVHSTALTSVSQI